MKIYHYTTVDNLNSIKRKGLIGSQLFFSPHPTLFRGNTFGTLRITFDAEPDDCIDEENKIKLANTEEIITKIESTGVISEEEAEIIVFGDIPSDLLIIEEM